MLTDPATSVGTAPLAHVPWFAELPLQVRLKYASGVNRWTAMERSVATLDSATGDDRSQSLVWRELLARHGVGDVASVVFRDRFGCWAFLELWRQDDRGSYSSEDVALLEISRLMFVSPATVQDHLKSVFGKTGTRNRRTLLARALGTSVSDNSV